MATGATRLAHLDIRHLLFGVRDLAKRKVVPCIDTSPVEKSRTLEAGVCGAPGNFAEYWNFNPLPHPEAAAEHTVKAGGEREARRRDVEKDTLSAQVAVNQQPDVRSSKFVHADFGLLLLNGRNDITGGSGSLVTGGQWRPTASQILPSGANE